MSTTPYAILGLLSIEPMSGYDIRRNLSEGLSYFWSESFGQIYPALRRLEAARLIVPAKASAPDHRRRKTYALTAAGRTHLRTWLGRPPKPQPPRHELLLKLFFGRHAPVGACTAHLRRLRLEQAQLAATLAGLERQLKVERAGHPDLRYWLAVLSFGVERAQSLADWSERTLRALDRTRR